VSWTLVCGAKSQRFRNMHMFDLVWSACMNKRRSGWTASVLWCQPWVTAEWCEGSIPASFEAFWRIAVPPVVYIPHGMTTFSVWFGFFCHWRIIRA